MIESKKINLVSQLVKNNRKLSQVVKLIKSFSQKYSNLASSTFFESEDFEVLNKELEELRIEVLSEAMELMIDPTSILAIPIEQCQGFAVYFVVLPSLQMFDWHSHPKMLGLSKCVFGQLQVNTLNKKLLKPCKENRLSYPKQDVQTSILNQQSRQLAKIHPQHNNIHRIKANKLSAFIDVMLPNYPQNNCDFFQLRRQNQQSLIFKQIEEPKQPVELLDSYCFKLRQVQKIAFKLTVLAHQ